MALESENKRPSFLEAVLENAGQAEMTALKERIVDVSQNVAELKLRVHDHLKNNFIEFDPLLKKSIGFLDKAVRTSDEINNLFNRIEFQAITFLFLQTKCDLANSTGELRNLHASLKEASVTLSITTELLQMEAAMKEVTDACPDGHYVDAAKSIQSFQELVRNSCSETQQLDIYQALIREFQSLVANFCYENTEKLYSFISWESNDIANNVVRSTLKIKSSCFKELQEVLQSLQLLNELHHWINKLRNFLMRSILLPLINNEGSVTIEDGELYSVMHVSIKTTSKRPSYLTTLDNLTKCFEFLHGELDMQFENNKSFINLLGAGCSEEFIDHLIKKCLKETVPSSSAELKKFDGIRERVAAFNNYMVGIEFLPEENHSLVDYVQNFNALCANKTCENYLKLARDIMKKDLQDMVEVGPEIPAVPISATLDNTSTDALIDNAVFLESFANVNIKSENELNPNLFQFPSCYVSKSILEILKLVGTILDEGVAQENELHQYYLSTAKSVFELYICVAPTIHEKLLNTIPQQVALFHNNCMYLAHRLVLLGFEVEASLRSVLKANIPVTFVDYVQTLRQLGTSTYLKHMQQQRKQMLDLVKESGKQRAYLRLATLGENSELSPDTERTLRQCLRQLELLQTVWQNVLPENVYCKSIGVLANAFIEELVLRVSTVEDIPANTAVKLTLLFKMVQERIPKLFQKDDEVVIFVKRWLQFQELINILSASLREIEENWADGKGPLAHEFTAEQVKQLIRALFQNTQRRAEVLSKIK
ncbi:Centromere/kinetochore protein zw10-like protein [Frankliniella fusca]|uniref:Centromere/kinetochore protein zw10-like protein n=1 Tax=Frankliniella fusca TaxID=407009 RepID=A0AAE1LQB2_9NEOP|nr:Centromere/kinetochore protein zw10-like protein [Frankliniella fusca]